jgi:hypothetical protein
MDKEYLGLVRPDGLYEVGSDGVQEGPIRLTSILPMEARSPESGELDIADSTGFLVTVKGTRSGDWIYAAEITEKAGPMLTRLVLALLNEEFDIPSSDVKTASREVTRDRSGC